MLDPAEQKQARHFNESFDWVIVWAFMGGLFVLLNFYAYGSWVTGEHFVPVETGLDTPPFWMYCLDLWWQDRSKWPLLSALSKSP